MILLRMGHYLQTKIPVRDCIYGVELFPRTKILGTEPGPLVRYLWALCYLLNVLHKIHKSAQETSLPSNEEAVKH